MQVHRPLHHGACCPMRMAIHQLLIRLLATLLPVFDRMAARTVEKPSLVNRIEPECAGNGEWIVICLFACSTEPVPCNVVQIVDIDGAVEDVSNRTICSRYKCGHLFDSKTQIVHYRL